MLASDLVLMILVHLAYHECSTILINITSRVALTQVCITTTLYLLSSILVGYMSYGTVMLLGSGTGRGVLPI